MIDLVPGLFKDCTEPAGGGPQEAGQPASIKGPASERTSWSGSIRSGEVARPSAWSSWLDVGRGRESPCFQKV